MGENKNKNIIFPLSPDPSLSDKKDVQVYLGFLKDALESKRIHNIAVTGGFGTGKSSLIRSYEQGKFKDVPLSHFLYTSVGEYASKCNEEGKGLASEKQSDAGEKGLASEDQAEELTSIRAIERRLLLQVFARFRRTDLPQTSFRLVPEMWSTHLLLTSILVGGFVFSALLLCFHKQLGTLLVAVNSMEGGPEWGAQIMTFLIKYKTLLRLLLSAYCIGFGTLTSIFLCFRILPRIRFHTFTLKGANAELSLENEAAESYLDLYSMELVYCLEKLAEKIDYVVVFEDLDRLNPKDCLYIITRLREINNLVNLRLQRINERICFIYAINDEFLGSVQHEKFFDYILPVIPEMNKRSSAILFAKKIEKIDSGYNALSVFPQFEIVASCLSDYRLQNTILNEYQVLKRLYTSPKSATKEDPTCGSAEAITPQISYAQNNEILAFSIYKNCWPGDYYALREGNSRIFTADGVKSDFNGVKYEKLLKVLAAPENHLLTLHSLAYMNFDETTLAILYFEHWEAAMADPEWDKRYEEVIAELDTIQKCESECLSKVREVFNSPSCFRSNDHTREYNVPLFRAVLNCMVRCEQEDNNWFFNGDLYNTCIKLLASLDGKEDETLKSMFFKLSYKNIPDKSNFYGATVTAINGYNNTGEYSYAEIKELCRGMKKIPNEVKIKIDKDCISEPESSNIVKDIRKEFSQAQSTPYFA